MVYGADTEVRENYAVFYKKAATDEERLLIMDAKDRRLELLGQCKAAIEKMADAKTPATLKTAFMKYHGAAKNDQQRQVIIDVKDLLKAGIGGANAPAN